MLHHLCIMRGPTTPSAGNKITSGYLTHALSGPKRGLKCYINPCILGGPTTPSAGNKIRSGYRTPAFSRAQMRVEVLHHPCILGGPTTPSAGNKIRSGYRTPAFSRVQQVWSRVQMERILICCDYFSLHRRLCLLL